MIGPGGRPGDPGPGYEPVNKYGINLDIDAGPETIWSHGGQFPFLSAGIEADFISSSSADQYPGGAGARTLIFTYFLSDFTRIIEEKELNGNNQVQLHDDFLFCSRIELCESGVQNKNVGEINVVDRATGLIVYQSVEIGEGQTFCAVDMCPKGKKGLVVKHIVGYSKFTAPQGAADMRFILRKANGSELTKHPVLISDNKQEDIVRYDIGGIKMSAGDYAYWQCDSVSAANTPIEARFDIKLEDA